MKIKLSSPPTADLLAASFDKHLPEISAMSADELLARVNFDVATAVSIVLGAEPALQSLRAEIAKKLPAFPMRYLDELESIAHAALYAHMRTMGVAAAADLLPKLTEDARRLRKTLASDATAAANRGLIEPALLDDVPMGNGRLDIARGVLGVAVVLRASWSAIKGRTAVTEKDLDDAARLGVELLAELGRDDNPTSSRGDTSLDEVRLRACSLLAKVYDECRRAVAYLRWHEDDLNDFAPAITGPRGPRSKKADDDGGQEPSDPNAPPAPSKPEP